jgi:hypothetical protein
MLKLIPFLILPVAFAQVSLTTAQVAKRVAPSVVVIHGKTDSGDVLGSGFIISKDGRIVTNLHVIMETRSATVQLANGEIYDSVSVLATDERRDLAILRVPGFNLPVLEMGDSDSLTIGEPVVILGTPRGLEGTVTAGILSSVRDSGEGFKVLQTDAAVNPGNSGGPLLNKKGQAIGVVSFKLRSSENLNFAVPINYVRGLLTTLHEPMPLEQVRTQFGATSTPAQKTSTPVQSEIMTEVSPAKMRSILKGMGFEFTEKSFDKSTAFYFQLNAYKTTLLSGGTDMQLYAGFSDKVDLTRVNEWNANYRFGRAYVNDEGGPSLENDLDFAGGITTNTIEAFITQFRTTLTTYLTFVKEVMPSTNAAAPTPATPASPTVDRSTPSPATAPSTPLRSYERSASATTRIKAPVGNFAIWIDETKWKQQTAKEAGWLEFAHVNGEAWATVITERIGIPTDGLREIALINAKSFDPNAKITFEETRIVNGRQVRALQIVGTTKGIPFRYFGYYHGGTSGTIQLVAYTIDSAFTENLAAFTEFLNGLEIMDEDLPPSSLPSSSQNTSTPTTDGLLQFNGNKMSVKYDSKKWKQTESSEVGRFTFNHRSGDGYAMIISERLTVPLDSLPDIALSNAKDADPNAKIVFREKRSVGGVDVWFLKLASTSNGIPLIYYGYYYGGKAGTVQVLTYTGANLITEYDKDFLEFLNGFRVSEF